MAPALKPAWGAYTNRLKHWLVESWKRNKYQRSWTLCQLATWYIAGAHAFKLNCRKDCDKKSLEWEAVLKTTFLDQKWSLEPPINLSPCERWTGFAKLLHSSDSSPQPVSPSEKERSYLCCYNVGMIGWRPLGQNVYWYCILTAACMCWRILEPASCF